MTMQFHAMRTAATDYQLFATIGIIHSPATINNTILWKFTQQATCRRKEKPLDGLGSLRSHDQPRSHCRTTTRRRLNYVRREFQMKENVKCQVLRGRVSTR